MQSYCQILITVFILATLSQPVATVKAESIANNLHLEAQRLIKIGKISEALALEAKASQLESKNFTFHRALVVIYTKLGQWESALEEAKQVVKLRPNDGKAYFNLATLFHQRGKTDQALKSYEKAIDLGDSDVDVHRGYALCLLESGRVAEAVPQLEKLSRQYPANKDVWLNLSWAYLLYEHLQPAMDAISQSLSLDPNYYPAVRLKAELLHASYYYDDAWSWAKRLIELEKTNPVGYWILVRFSYAGFGEIEKATYVLKEALTNIPQATGLYYEMGTGFLDIGKRLSLRHHARFDPQPWFSLAESSLKHCLNTVAPKSNGNLEGKANAALAELMLLTRRPYDALPYAQKAAVLMPGNKDIETLLSKASLAQNDLAGALKRWMCIRLNSGISP